MIPSGVFKVGAYDCYVETIVNIDTVNIVIVGTFPILHAERAASSVARRLGSSEIILERLYTGRGVMYACRINNVNVKELEKWQV